MNWHMIIYNELEFGDASGPAGLSRRRRMRQRRGPRKYRPFTHFHRSYYIIGGEELRGGGGGRFH